MVYIKQVQHSDAPDWRLTFWRLTFWRLTFWRLTFWTMYAVLN